MLNQPLPSRLVDFTVKVIRPPKGGLYQVVRDDPQSTWRLAGKIGDYTLWTHQSMSYFEVMIMEETDFDGNLLESMTIVFLETTLEISRFRSYISAADADVILLELIILWTSMSELEKAALWKPR